MVGEEPMAPASEKVASRSAVPHQGRDQLAQHQVCPVGGYRHLAHNPHFCGDR